MEKITQGTMITGIRSAKYPDQSCCGIVISARCDLANDKIDKIFYLTGIHMDEWVMSCVGFNVLISPRIADLNKKLENLAESNGLSWNELKRFSFEDFEKVIQYEENKIKKKDQNNMCEYFQTAKKYSQENLGIDEKKEIYSKERKLIESMCQQIIAGKNTHFSFIPEDAYLCNECTDKGIIIDHQELDFIDPTDMNLILNMEIDQKNKNLEDKEKYNKKFMLSDPPGYAMAEYTITSPWIEYLMQRFSNTFIRIGVDTPQNKDISNAIERILTN